MNNQVQVFSINSNYYLGEYKLIPRLSSPPAPYFSCRPDFFIPLTKKNPYQVLSVVPVRKNSDFTFFICLFADRSIFYINHTKKMFCFVFSSPEHIVLMVSYCYTVMSVVSLSVHKLFHLNDFSS